MSYHNKSKWLQPGYLDQFLISYLIWVNGLVGTGNCVSSQKKPWWINCWEEFAPEGSFSNRPRDVNQYASVHCSCYCIPPEDLGKKGYFRKVIPPERHKVSRPMIPSQSKDKILTLWFHFKHINDWLIRTSCSCPWPAIHAMYSM